MNDTKKNYIELKNGNWWNLNEAYQGDCLDFMRELPDKCIDLVLTDPPYGIGAGKEKEHNGWKDYGQKKWDAEIPQKKVFDEIFRISKNQIIWGGNYFTDYLSGSQGWIVWNKGQRNFSLADGELAYTSFDKALRIFDYARASALKDGKIHPTQKPLKLFKWCLEKYAPEDAIVFDPFLGSFTTAVACHSHGLNWIGCEKDEDYFNAGMERYETECLQELLQF